MAIKATMEILGTRCGTWLPIFSTITNRLWTAISLLHAHFDKDESEAGVPFSCIVG